MDNGFEIKMINLNKPDYGLYIPSMIWHGFENFSSGSVCLVLTSNFYDENDYIRDYQLFKKIIIKPKIRENTEKDI